MSEKDRIEKVLQKRQNKLIRKKNLVMHFHWFADKYHLPWIHELVKRYKELGEYPIIPCRELAMRYTDYKDKEIAAFMGFAIRYNGDYSVINEAMEELGERPWEWFINRVFVRLSVGDMQNQKTCGQKNWKIAQMFHNLHTVFIHSECSSLGEAMLLTCKQTLTPLDQYIEELFENCDFKHRNDELHTLILVLSNADGIGLSIWPVSPPDIHCPLTDNVRAFLGYWWPNIVFNIPIRECFAHFGLSDGDFFIASIAYARLKEKHPVECVTFERSYSRWFKQNARGDYRKWRKHQQSIGFGF